MLYDFNIKNMYQDRIFIKEVCLEGVVNHPYCVVYTEHYQQLI